MSKEVLNNERPSAAAQPTSTSKLIDWFHEGEAKTVEVDGVRITVRFVGRKGRRGRIAIEAPAGAVFGTGECAGTDKPHPRS